MNSAGIMHTEHVVTAGQRATKRRQRKRLPAPKFRTPRAAIRRFNDLITRITHDHLGGRELLTVEREMVRQAAAIMLRTEQLQAGIVKVKPPRQSSCARSGAGRDREG